MNIQEQFKTIFRTVKKQCVLWPVTVKFRTLFVESDLLRRLRLRLDDEYKEIATLLRNKPKRFLTLDFNENAVVLLALEWQNKEYRIQACRIQEGLSFNEKDALKDFIGSFLQENSLTTRDIFVNLSSVDSLYIKLLHLPGLPAKEVPSAVKWQLKEDVHYSIDQAVIGWHLLKEYTDSEGLKKKDYICFAFPRKIVENYRMFFKSCGLRLLGLLSNSFNYANVLKTQPQAPWVCSVLDVGLKESTLNIYVNHRLNFSRSFPFSWEKLLQALTGTVASTEGHVALSLTDAEEILAGVGIPIAEHTTEDTRMASVRILSLIRPHLETLTRELRLSFNYFVSSAGIEMPKSLFVAAYARNLKNLDVYLKNEFDLSVFNFSVASSLEGQAHGPLAFPADQKERLLNGYCLALNDFRETNLMPKDIQQKTVRYVQKALFRLALILGTATFLFMVFAAGYRKSDYRRRVANARLHLATIEHMRNLQQKILFHNFVISKIQKNKIPVVGMLKFLSQAIPDQIVLDELSFQQTGQILTLKGYTLGEETAQSEVITDFMQQLEDSSFFDEVSLISTQQSPKGQNFIVQCDTVSKQ